MKIIDTHVHYWNPEHLTYDWLGNVPTIGKAHLPDDYRKAVGDLDVETIVFVEADCQAQQALDEVLWVESLVESEPRIKGIVAAAALEKGDAVADHLESLYRHKRVKGVRRLIQGEKKGFCNQPAFVEAVRMLPQYGLSFDLCIKHPQFPEIIQLVQQCPETHFILDHIGKPGIADAMLDPWRAHIKELAGFSNVIGCKLSGLITEANHDTWTADDLMPYLEHVVSSFGTDRVIYGSDWPVSVLAGGYQRWWEAFSIFLKRLSPEEQAKVTASNAAKIYRL